MNKLGLLWQLKGIGFGSTKPVFCDLDNDNTIEIITGNLSGDLMIISGDDGKIKKRSNFIQHRIKDVVVSDVNNDGLLEILLATDHPNITVLDSNLDHILYRVSLPSLPLKVYVADIDADHLSEVLVVDVTSSINIIKSNRIISRLSLSKPIYALNYGKIRINNNRLDGLVVVHNNTISIYEELDKLELINEKTLTMDISKARIIDVNNDGIDEIAIASHGNLSIMYDVGKYDVASFQLFKKDVVNFDIGDLDRDSKKEIIAIGQQSMGNRLLRIFTFDGELISEYQLPFDGSKILIGDINGDGSNEMILSDTSGKELFCLDVRNKRWCRWISQNNFLFIDLYDINCDLKDEIILRTIDKLVVLTYYDS